MATVKIGGRELSVKVATLGFMRHRLIPARRKLSAAPDEIAKIEALAEMVLVYLDHNEGVTLDWVFDNVPADASLLNTLHLASGQEASPEGEAKRP